MYLHLWGLVNYPELVGFISSVVVAWALVLTKGVHGTLSMDTQLGVQKFHTHPTPRIGGVAIVLGVSCAYWVAPKDHFYGLLWPLLLASTPAFTFGLVEDLTKRVSVRARLLATMASGVLGWWITGLSITDANVWGLDALLGISVVSVLFTAFAVGGVANAINIVDGFNGLSSGAVIIALLGLGSISLQAQDVEVAHLCILFALLTLGFLLVNWPWGKLFLGDGGAYFLGFALAWISVLLLGRNPEVSAWGPMLACGYPILEVGFSIWRRKKRNLSPGDPDRLHLHSLVKRRIVRNLFPAFSNTARNSITGACMWLAAGLPAYLGAQYWAHTPSLIVAFVLCAYLYSLVYARLTQFRWCIAPATLRASSDLAPEKRTA